MNKISEHLAKDMKKSAGKPKEPKSKAKSSHSFHVKQADGGFVVETRKEGGNDFDPGTTSIHKNSSSVKKHMDTCCGTSEPE